MEFAHEIISKYTMYLGLAGLACLAAFGVFYFASKALARLRALWGRDRLSAIVSVVIVAGFTMYGGSKGIGWKVNVDEGIIDRGSYATNDTFVAKWNYEGAVIAASWLYVDYKENGDTNAWGRVCDTNWYNLGKCRVTELEHAFELENATNYFYYLYSDFEPTPVVHTNGVYCFYVAKPIDSSPVKTNRFIAVRSYINAYGRKVMPLPKDEFKKEDEDE